MYIRTYAVIRSWKEETTLSHQKPKRLKKSGNKVEPASYINLVTAILQLVTTIILLIEAVR